MAANLGAFVTGIDATSALLTEAKERIPEINFMLGKMEELPVGDDTFDIVCGFNLFQYAASIANALAEATCVFKNGG